MPIEGDARSAAQGRNAGIEHPERLHVRGALLEIEFTIGRPDVKGLDVRRAAGERIAIAWRLITVELQGKAERAQGVRLAAALVGKDADARDEGRDRRCDRGQLLE